MLADCPKCGEPLFDHMTRCPKCGAGNRDYARPAWHGVAAVIAVYVFFSVLNSMLPPVAGLVFAIVTVLAVVVFGAWQLRLGPPWVRMAWVLGDLVCVPVSIVLALITAAAHFSVSPIVIFCVLSVVLLRVLSGREKAVAIYAHDPAATPGAPPEPPR